ncbi:MAG: hypothetical protein KAX77_01275 [Xanthomonadales bacterium]|nr:hypothetical protein [Xanthomonadales bacterium]
MARDLPESWVSRAWTLTYGSILLATALLLGDQIKAATWLQVFTIVSAGFYGINAIEKWRKQP